MLHSYGMNQEWVTPKDVSNNGGPPKWSLWGVLLGSDDLPVRDGVPSVWVCAYTKGCRKVYEKKAPVVSKWSGVMDHLANYHGFVKDDQYPLVRSETVTTGRAVTTQRDLESGLSESDSKTFTPHDTSLRTS